MTSARLRDINRRFYTEFAAEFEHARENPWPGFDRILNIWNPNPHQENSVLDVGAGHGRFLSFLERRVDPPWSYLGVDESPILIARARERIQDRASVSLSCMDVLDDALEPPGESRVSGRYSLITALGFWHHIPGKPLQEAFLRWVRAHLLPDGLFVLTLWRLLNDPRTQKKVVSWNHYNALAKDPIDLCQLGPADVLLRFGEDPNAVRYCHHALDPEVMTMLERSSLVVVDAFDSDGASGDFNRYLAIRPAPASQPPSHPTP